MKYITGTDLFCVATCEWRPRESVEDNVICWVIPADLKAVCGDITGA